MSHHAILFIQGRLTDGKGKTVECKNAIFIMTSNLASDEIAQHALRLRKEASDYAKKRLELGEDEAQLDEEVSISRKFKDQVVRPILKRHFRRDEFLGRINEFVYFLPFSNNELRELVVRELDAWAQRAYDRHGIKMTWDKQTVDALITGYDVHYGARSLKYEVDRRIVNQLAAAHESGLISKGAEVHFHVKESVIADPKKRRKPDPIKDIYSDEDADQPVKNAQIVLKIKSKAGAWKEFDWTQTGKPIDDDRGPGYMF